MGKLIELGEGVWELWEELNEVIVGVWRRIRRGKKNGETTGRGSELDWLEDK